MGTQFDRQRVSELWRNSLQQLLAAIFLRWIELPFETYEFMFLHTDTARIGMRKGSKILEPTLRKKSKAP